MIAPDQRQVRAWRQRVRARVNANPALRAQRRETSRLRRLNAPQVFRALVPLALLSLGVSQLLGDQLVPLLVAWTAIITCFRAQQMLVIGSASFDNCFYYHMPLGNDAIFAHYRSQVRRDALWLGLDWLAAGVAMAITSGDSQLWLFAPLLALAQAAVALALALHAARFVPRFPYGLVACGLFIGLLVAGRLHENPELYRTWIAPPLQALGVATPGGWLAQALQAVRLHHFGGWLAATAMTSIALGLLPVVWAHWGRGFSLEETFGYHDGTAGQPVILDEELELPNGDFVPDGKTAITSEADLDQCRARIRHHLAAAPGSFLHGSGLLQRLILRCLSTRQRVLTDFHCPGATWSRTWGIALLGLGFIRLLQLGGLPLPWVTTLTAVTLGSLTLPLFGGLWQGAVAQTMLQSSIAWQSYHPIGFWENSRVRILVNGLRLVAALPLLLLGVRFGVSVPPLGWVESLDWTIRLALAVFALQPIWVIVSYSTTSNDSTSRWWFSLLLIAAMVLAFIVLMGLGIALFVVSGFGFALMNGLLLVLSTHLLLAVYGRAYRRHWFDLMANART